MSAIYFMLPASVLLAGFFLGAYIWSVRTGQFEDTQTPALRILPDDKPNTPKPADSEADSQNTTP
jgi:cbb3-type cytochrome oxidase maturation protein